jgi:hypothetical protein
MIVTKQIITLKYIRDKVIGYPAGIRTAQSLGYILERYRIANVLEKGMKTILDCLSYVCSVKEIGRNLATSRAAAVRSMLLSSMAYFSNLMVNVTYSSESLNRKLTVTRLHAVGF